jgi:hypothetical protein
VKAYSFHLEGKPSADSEKAKHIANVMGWPIKVCEVKTDNLKEDWERAQKFGCWRKAQIECLVPFFYILPEIEEKYVLSGMGAEHWYGFSRKFCQHWRHDRKTYDAKRLEMFEIGKGSTFQLDLLAQEYDKICIHPYAKYGLWSEGDERIERYFLSKDWWELNDGKPIAGSKQKCLTRKAYEKELNEIGNIKRHANLQIESGMNVVFEEILGDAEWNLDQRSRMIDLARDKTKELVAEFSSRWEEMPDEDRNALLAEILDDMEEDFEEQSS